MINFDVQKKLGPYSDKEAAGTMHAHHVVFRSQGGVDHYYSKIKLPMGFHEGNRGPHRNKDTDIALKREMQKELFDAFSEGQIHMTLIPFCSFFNQKIKGVVKKFVGNWKRQRTSQGNTKRRILCEL